MKVTIPSDQPTREYEFKGKWYVEQEAAIFAGGHYPKPFTVTSHKGESYPKGDYVLDPRSFEVTERGKLVLSRVRLLPTSGVGK